MKKARRLALCLLALGFGLGLAGNSRADVGTEIWTKIHDGGNGNDYGRSVAIDSLGNVIMAGNIKGAENHGTNGLAIKYDPDGNPIWSHELDAGVIGGSGGADSSDLYMDVCVDSEDNMILVGIVAEVWPVLPTNQSMLIQKYNSSGTLLWERRYYDYGWAGIQGVDLDANDNIYVTGNLFTNWVSVAGQWATLKYDKNGNLVLGPIFYDYSSFVFLPEVSYDIAVDNEGNIIAVGVRGESGYEGGITNDNDWHVRKYDSTGALIWQDTYSGAANLYDYARGVAVDSNGDIFVAGYTNKGTDNYDNSDYDWLVIKYAAEGVAGLGQRLWTRTFESATGRSEACYDVVVDDQGNVLVGGYEQDNSDVAHWRLEKLNGGDGSLLSEQVWDATYNQAIYGVTLREDLIALGGYAGNGIDHDMRTTLLSILAEPAPDIKANGEDGPLVVMPGENVDVTVSLEPGSMTGEACDWWIGALTTFGTYWLNPSLNWVPSDSPISVGQYPLFDLSEMSLLDIPLPEGIYMFFFVLDDTPDGTFGVTWYDYVNVICQPEAAPVQAEEIPDFDAVFHEKMKKFMGE